MAHLWRVADVHFGSFAPILVCRSLVCLPDNLRHHLSYPDLPLRQLSFTGFTRPAGFTAS
jgi:hypothetical protein